MDSKYIVTPKALFELHGAGDISMDVLLEGLDRYDEVTVKVVRDPRWRASQDRIIEASRKIRWDDDDLDILADNFWNKIDQVD